VTKQKVAREESVAEHDGNNRAPHHGSIKFNDPDHRVTEWSDTDGIMPKATVRIAERS